MQCLYKRQTLIRRPQSKTAVECLANLSDDNSNDNRDDNDDEDGVKHPKACTAHQAACGGCLSSQTAKPISTECAHACLFSCIKDFGRKKKGGKQKKEKNEKEEERKKGVNLAIL